MFERLKRQLQRLGNRSNELTSPEPSPPAGPDPQVAPKAETSPLVSRLLAAASVAAQAPRQEANGATDHSPDQTVIRINGRRYAHSDLPDELQQLIQDLQTADALMRLRQERLAVLARGQLGMIERLRRGLLAIAPMAEPSPGAGPQPSTRQT
ncbi:MAG: hypothetical protein EBR33_04365 [Synechococcaceae bacterium WB4_1_0192]|jgi:hypothetical protein|nr:hypothetical protein [Synechococcaceae bacterium WB4_1_0192]